MKNKNYFPEIDALKGISILFIIFSHSFCEFPLNIRANLPILQHFSVSFALCLFFICSGFLFRNDEPWKVFLKKKSTRLLVPMLFFGYVNVCLRLFMAPFTRSKMGWEILTYPLTGQLYWFLYSLFLIMMLDKTLSRYGKMKFIIAGVLLLLHETLLKDISIFTINRTSYFYTFFLLGRLIRQNYEFLISYCKKYRLALCFFMFYVLSFTLAHTIFSWETVPSILGGIIIPLSACSALWSVCLMIEKSGPNTIGFLHYFGKYSLQYYLNHMLVLLAAFYCGKMVYSYSGLYILSLLTVFSLTVSICFVMLRIERHFPQKTKILFGL